MAEARLPGIFVFIRRGLGYALTSAFALISGYVIQSEIIFGDCFILLLIPFSLSISFFISYAICFHYENPNIKFNERDLKQQQRDAIIVTILLSITVSIIIGLYYYFTHKTLASFGKDIFLQQIFLSIIYGCLFNIYALILYTYRVKNRNLLLRHQLIWPAILSIAIGLYLGLSFENHSNPFVKILPLVILISYFTICELLIKEKKAFLKSGLILYFGSIIIIALGKKYQYLHIDIYESVSAMLFSIAISAYIASFEAWRITSYVSGQFQVAESNAAGTNTPLESNSEKTESYFLSTLGGLTLAGVTLPFIFIFSDYGLVLICGFLFHFIISFIYWNNSGDSLNKIGEKNWVFRKIVFGFLFLLLMIIDSKYTFLQNKTVLKRFLFR